MQLREMNGVQFIENDSFPGFFFLDDRIDDNEEVVQDLLDFVNYLRMNKFYFKFLDIFYIAKLVVDALGRSFFENKTFVSVGTGGYRFKSAIERYADFKLVSYQMECHHDMRTNIISYNSDLSLLQENNITILEDYIASGKTIENVSQFFLNRGIDIETVVSAAGNVNANVASNTRIICGVLLTGAKIGQDPYWYPPFYSFRHIRNRENGQANFWEMVYEKYFPNSKIVKK